MSSNFNRLDAKNTSLQFSEALFATAESSRMSANPVHLTTFNAGDIVPIYCREVLPYEKLSLDIDFVVRQTTLLTPTMGNMSVDIEAFFVPNRVVNQSFKAVMGEAYNKSWTANKVTLAPLYVGTDDVQIPVGSVADYYGFPTQQPMPSQVLSQMHDLKFRGYVMIYNEFFRDQNYQPPIAMSTLNVYQGFLGENRARIPLNGDSISPQGTLISQTTQPDGSFAEGAIVQSLYGNSAPSSSVRLPSKMAINSFFAVNSPLKANKLHDYFTSVLPSPQKAPVQVLIPVSGQVSSIPVVTTTTDVGTQSYGLHLKVASTGAQPTTGVSLTTAPNGALASSSTGGLGAVSSLYPSNLVTIGDAPVTGLSFDISDLRMAAAIQQVYEALGRGGSRYREYLRSFFNIDVDDPFDDIPKRLGRVIRDLDLYQTAQTSSSVEGSTPQGNLAAFGYTSNGGTLFKDISFIENGYIHVFAIVRHKNIYPSYLSRDNFRRSMLDFYQPQLANISEQPLYAYELNPFAQNPNNAIGYQEAWSEYRFEPDYVTGLMRPGVDNNLSIWNYADEFDSGLQVINGEFIKSNSQAVLDRTLAVKSSVSPQLKGAFMFKVDKTLPMPTCSVPGMDII